ncbi:hypothetical protein ACFOGG_05025 [Brenneria rubrifaciens]|uniref:hypothetical protein n=1 Tax=Brenneria rubrifaciens TaxID=55213 RepID=UPI003618F434
MYHDGKRWCRCEYAASVPGHVVRHVMRSGPDLRVKARRSPEDPGCLGGLITSASTAPCCLTICRQSPDNKVRDLTAFMEGQLADLAWGDAGSPT